MPAMTRLPEWKPEYEGHEDPLLALAHDPNVHAFVKAIHANPRDPLPYGVFADWLDEQGHNTLATIFRRTPAFWDYQTPQGGSNAGHVKVGPHLAGFNFSTSAHPHNDEPVGSYPTEEEMRKMRRVPVVTFYHATHNGTDHPYAYAHAPILSHEKQDLVEKYQLRPRTEDYGWTKKAEWPFEEEPLHMAAPTATPALPTRRSLGRQVSQPKMSGPTEKGIAYSLDNGAPTIRTPAGHYSYHLDSPEAHVRFEQHMDRLGTPEAQHMKKAVATGHQWTVNEPDFEHFMKFDPQHIAAIGNAEPGDVVGFRHYKSQFGPYEVSMQGRGKNAGAISLRQFDPEAGDVTLHSLQGPVDSPRGWGANSLHKMVNAARAMGLRTLRMQNAAGHAGSKVFNGYYTWPRLGFQGGLHPEAAAKLPPHLRHFTDLHSLMDHPEGPEYWKDHGSEVYNLHFDTSPDSPHVQRLVKYLRGIQNARRSKQS